MSIRIFQRYVRTEEAAARTLQRYRFGTSETGFGRLPGARCPRCATGSAYTLADGRWRCRACRYTFGLLTETWLEACRLSPATWLGP